MNNVWTAIAHKAPCAARRPQSKPLLHLFNGYTRNHYSSVRGAQISAALQDGRRMFATSPFLYAGKKGRSSVKSTARRPPPPLDSTPKPPLERAPTVASHTEGLPAEEVQLTWRDYDPLGGMPLPDGERTQSEINAIFNSEEIDVDVGNYILSVLHWRRQSGALIDVGVDFPKDSDVSREAALKGLQYLRTIDPNVDEAANGEVWAQEESQRLSQELQERAVKLGLYKSTPQEEEYGQQGEETGSAEGQLDQQSEQDRTSKSILQSVRERNEERAKEQQAAREAEEERAKIAAVHAARGPLDLGGGVQPNTDVKDLKVVRSPFGGNVTIRPPKAQAWLSYPVERKPWVKYYEEQAQITKDHALPNISTARRFGPPFLILCLTLAACYYLSVNYTPPPRSARMWPDMAPAVATMSALTGILLATFLMGRMPPLWRTYSKYMTLVPAYPYAISLVGQLFRHDTVAHLASNLVSLWIFGLLLHEDVGRGTFLAIYLSSGVVGAYSSLVYNVVRKEFTAYILGSSGCVLGVFAATCTLRPNGTISCFGYDVPIAAWVFLSLFGAAEAFAVLRGMKSRIDHAGHLGGIITGFASAIYLRQKSRDEQHQGSQVVGEVIEELKDDVKGALDAA